MDQRTTEGELSRTMLRLSCERTQLALSAARMGIWEADLKTGALIWSDALSALFGIHPVDAPKTTEEFFKLVHPEDRLPIRQGVERTIRDHADLVKEFRVVWPDGTVHWLAGRAHLVMD